MFCDHITGLTKFNISVIFGGEHQMHLKDMSVNTTVRKKSMKWSQKDGLDDLTF